MESSCIREPVGDNSRAVVKPVDLNLVSDVVQAMDCDAEAAILDELGALLPLLGAPEAPAIGGGGGGCEGGDPGGVIELHTGHCKRYEPCMSRLQTSVVEESPSYQ
ncbi:hypothetical protein Tco_0063652 [Tanacetum coccineum]